MKFILLLSLLLQVDTQAAIETWTQHEPGSSGPATNLLCDMHEEFRIYVLLNANTITRTITEHDQSLGGCVSVRDAELESIRAMNDRAMVDFYIRRCQEEIRQNIRAQRPGGCR